MGRGHSILSHPSLPANLPSGTAEVPPVMDELGTRGFFQIDILRDIPNAKMVSSGSGDPIYGFWGGGGGELHALRDRKFHSPTETC